MIKEERIPIFDSKELKIKIGFNISFINNTYFHAEPKGGGERKIVSNITRFVPFARRDCMGWSISDGILLIKKSYISSIVYRKEMCIITGFRNRYFRPSCNCIQAKIGLFN